MYLHRVCTVLGVCLAVLWATSITAAGTLWLDELDMGQVAQDWGKAHRNQSVDGHPLRIGGQSFERGVGTHANSILVLRLDGGKVRVSGSVGVDEEVAKGYGSVQFQILADGKLVWESPVLKSGQPVKPLDLNLAHAESLALVVADAGDGIDYDHADWAETRIEYTGKKPVVAVPDRPERVVLTPPASATPKIHGPVVFGVRPGRPFLFRIPATGTRPMRFSAAGLPAGLSVDAHTGIITGQLDKPGTWTVTLEATSELGSDQRTLRIAVGDTIALTPPLGWNSWNCWACSVDDTKVRAAARAMVDSGLADHGFTYINIDDCWHGKRDESTGEIQPNKKFPDMKALADYVHSLGLKLGIYTDCGPKTCAGYEGSKGHEEQDMMTYAKWGIDYVKIDWCNTKGMDPEKSYAVFGRALEKCPRDIVFSICDWGVKQPWTWGTRVGGNAWRTTGDIRDTWGSMASIGFGQADLAKYASPGHWNDPDMLVVGKVGWGPKLHDSHLNANEQYTHISLWCMLSAPLLIGCDMSKLDPFTLNLLSNDDVLAIDQEPLGRQARRVAKTGFAEVWAKDLQDGSKAVALFNRGLLKCDVTATWKQLGIEGPQTVRDLWRQKNIGVMTRQFQATVPPHGVVLVHLSAGH